MDKTPFSKKCEMISLFSEYGRDQEWAKGFFLFFDLGIPYAIGINGDHIVPTESGIKVIEETWDAFCEILGVDNHGNYSDLDELLRFAGVIS